MASNKKELTVKNSNRLARAAYRLSLVEQRLILLAIASADGVGEDLKRVRIDAQEYAEKFNLSLQSAYQDLERASKTLFERRYTLIDEIDGHERIRLRRWVQGVDYVKSAGYITMIFSDDVMPELIAQKQRFTYYYLNDISSLTSTYAHRLYQFLISWRGLSPAEDGKRTTHKIELNELRERLGVEPEKYKIINNFKKRVLDLAIEQINEHTNLIAAYHQYKTGRRVAGFYFTFEFKNGYERSIHKPITSAPERDPNTIKTTTLTDTKNFFVKTNAEAEAKAKAKAKKAPRITLEEFLQRHLQQQDEKHIKKLTQKRLSTL